MTTQSQNRDRDPSKIPNIGKNKGVVHLLYAFVSLTILAQQNNRRSRIGQTDGVDINAITPSNGARQSAKLDRRGA